MDKKHHKSKDLGELTGLNGINDLGMDMTPPESKPLPIMKNKKKGPRIVTRNTGSEIQLDPQDFEVAKFIHWYEWKGQIVNQSGVPIETYCRIPGERLDGVPEYDYRRQFFR